MKPVVSALAAAVLLGGAPAALAQAQTDPAAAQPVIVRLPAKSAKPLMVTSPSIRNGGDIDFTYTQYRGNHFPGFRWTAGPAGTVTYALIMQDTDLVYRNNPILHWVLFNIPASVTELPTTMTAPPAGASYGPNYKGVNQPYLGPRTPPGPKHHYHFEVFALDTTVPAGAGSSFDVLVGAMKGHVLASGEMVGLAQADTAAAH